MFAGIPTHCPEHGALDPMQSLLIAIALSDQMHEGDPTGYADALNAVCPVELWAGFQQLALILLDECPEPRALLAALRAGLTYPMGDMQ